MQSLGTRLGLITVDNSLLYQTLSVEEYILSDIVNSQELRTSVFHAQEIYGLLLP